MALSYSTATWDNNINKRPPVQALLNSKAKIYTIRVTFGGTDDYSTGGVTADIKQGKCNDILYAQCFYTDSKCLIQYDIANGKIQAFGQTPTSATATAIAFDELDASDQALRSKVFDFLVIGI